MKREIPLPYSPAGDGADWAWPLAFAEHACCCPARSMVTEVMPAVHGRRYPMDLLLCGHHYRVSEIALLAVGATVYDETGIVLPAGEEPVLAQAAGRGHVTAAQEGAHP